MVLPVIVTREQYEVALANVEELMSSEVGIGSDECERLEALAQAVELYEKEHFPIEPPSPVAEGYGPLSNQSEQGASVTTKTTKK